MFIDKITALQVGHPPAAAACLPACLPAAAANVRKSGLVWSAAGGAAAEGRGDPGEPHPPSARRRSRWSTFVVAARTGVHAPSSRTGVATLQIGTEREAKLAALLNDKQVGA
jgi:hypothetical protein